MLAVCMQREDVTVRGHTCVHAQVVRVLLQYEADVDDTSPITHFSALMLAASKGHLDTCEALLAAGADANYRRPAGHGGDTALMRAAVWGDRRTVRCLLKSGARSNDVDARSDTALLLAATAGHRDVLLELSNYCDINAASRDGETALHLACRNGHISCVKALLINPQLELEPLNTAGETPADLALAGRLGEVRTRV